MKINRRIMLVSIIPVLALLLILLINGGGNNRPVKKPPQAVNGVLDLTGWDLARDGMLPLNGEWEFYWGQLLTPADFERGRGIKTGVIQVPGSWAGYTYQGKPLPADGYATYRLMIKPRTSSANTGIHIYYAATSYKLWVNQELLMANGVVGKNHWQTKAQLLPSMVLFRMVGQDLQLVVQVASFGYSRSGLVSRLLWGTAAQIQVERETQLAMDLFLFGSILIMGFYHLALFLLRRKDRSNLYFGILSILIAVKVTLMGGKYLYSLFPGWSPQLLLDFSALTQSLGLPFFILYIRELFPQDIPKRLNSFSLWLTYSYTAVVLALPEKWSNLFLIPFQIIVLFILGYLIYIFIHLIRKREGVALVITGVCFLLLMVLGDSITNLISYSSVYFIPFGILAFIMIQSFLLSQKFVKSFATVELLSERLLRLDKLKDEFLADTSHELRGPLHGIIGIAETMAEGVTGPLNRQQASNLSLIVASGRRLFSLVNDLQDFSRLKYRDLVLQKKPVDIKQAVEVVLALYRPLVAGKNVRLEQELAEGLPPVEGDENRIQQILHNLIGNAVKFTETGRIWVAAAVRESFLEITVADTGIGIPQDRLADIFKSYEQLNEVTSGDSGGTGLGLSITKHLVELHGGAIWAESEPGQGSRFRFTLPISGVKPETSPEHIPLGPFLEETVAALTQPAPKMNSNNFLTIMLVDDDPVHLQMLANYLSLQGYPAIAVSDGRRALELVEEDPKNGFDLIIMDVRMPGLSGYETCRALREKHTMVDLPILLLTSNNQPNDILAGFAAGANDYLVKPFDKREFLARVNALLTLKKAAKQEEMLRRAEIRALQSKIRPHFLFNALSTISTLCRVNGEKARELLGDLSNYLRSGFSFQDHEEFVPLDTELGYVRSYLAIEAARFGERLQAVFDIRLKTPCKIPPLILQPLVENAVRHGLLPQKEGGTIKVSAWKQKGFLFLRVEDDGVGIPADKVKKLLQDSMPGAGVGVSNVNHRLKSIYGQELLLESQEGKGTVATVRIPIGGEPA
ncbi:MAG TPA: ATP-binding protein [Bacillota bacterium]|nr:ATP-binding protein [Bacillota bacterium]